MIFLLIPLFCLAIVGLIYAWVVTVDETRKRKFAGWRKALAWIGVLAVTAQLGLLLSILFLIAGKLSRDQQLAPVNWILKADLALLLLTLPCALPRTGWTRWFLLFASVFLLGTAAFAAAISQFTY